jgi:Family of unknown function (DUF6350)
VSTTAAQKVDDEQQSPRTRPDRRVRHDPEQSGKPRALVGIALALWTAALGLATVVCLTLAAWVTANHHDSAIRPALSTAVQIWLLGHRTTLRLLSPSGAGTGSFSMVPLGLTFLLGVALVRAGRRAARLSAARDLLDCTATAAAVAVPYAVLAALLTAAAQTSGVRPAALEALVGALVLAFGCVGFGALRETGLAAPLLGRIGADVQRALRAGLAASAIVVGSGALLVAAAVAAHGGQVGAAVTAQHGGLAAATLNAVISMAYVPNAAVWAGAYAAGPGFAVGAGTSWSIVAVHAGAVPAVPLLAALPAGSSAASWLSLAVPVAAGTVVGRLVCSRPDPAVADPARSWWSSRGDDARWVALAAAVSGVALGIAGWLAGGSLAGGRMAVLGPSPWLLCLVVAGEVGAVGAAAACLIRRFDHRAVVTLPD